MLKDLDRIGGTTTEEIAAVIPPVAGKGQPSGAGNGYAAPSGFVRAEPKMEIFGISL